MGTCPPPESALPQSSFCTLKKQRQEKGSQPGSHSVASGFSFRGLGIAVCVLLSRQPSLCRSGSRFTVGIWSLACFCHLGPNSLLLKFGCVLFWSVLVLFCFNIVSKHLVAGKRGSLPSCLNIRNLKLWSLCRPGVMCGSNFE